MWLLHWLGVPSLFLILLKGFVDHLIFLMCLLVMFPTFVLLINIFWDKEGEKASGTATRWKNHNQPCEPLSVWQMWLCSMFIRRGVKKRIFYGQADCKRSPPPPYGQLCEFFLCSFDHILWSYMFWNGFYTRKVNFHATNGIPNSSSDCCCPPDAHLQEAGPSFWQLRKGHEKCIFETLHNEIKCVLSSKNQI